MVPNLIQSYHTRFIRAWWRKPCTPMNKVINYYNTYVLPIAQDYSLRMLIKAAFERVLQHMDSLHIFDDDNHFITNQRVMIMDNEENMYAMLCNHCYKVKRHTFDRKKHKFTRLSGNEHFTLRKTLIYNLLLFNAIWCFDCKGSCFDWHTADRCPQCTK